MEAIPEAEEAPCLRAGVGGARVEGPLELPAGLVRARAAGLELPEGVIERAAAALSAGKHLILAGPPGTGKTALALALGEAARAAGFCGEVMTATASADWTTFDTIGGYALGQGGALRFREGLFLRAIDRGAWLVVDELNRADADRAFGELLTVLAGHAAVTPFVGDDGRPVSIGSDPASQRRVPPTFRVVATMNTWDRASLFRLSYALERRFARVHVGVPDDAAYARLIRRAALGEGEGSPLESCPAPRAPGDLLRLGDPRAPGGRPRDRARTSSATSGRGARRARRSPRRRPCTSCPSSRASRPTRSARRGRSSTRRSPPPRPRGGARKLAERFRDLAGEPV